MDWLQTRQPYFDFGWGLINFLHLKVSVHIPWAQRRKQNNTDKAKNCWHLKLFFQIHVLPRSLSLLCVCFLTFYLRREFGTTLHGPRVLLCKDENLVARVSVILVAGTSLSGFSLMSKLPGPPEECCYRDLKKKTSSSSNNDGNENKSCYRYGIDEIPYLS